MNNEVKITKSEGNKIAVECNNDDPTNSFAFYLFKDSVIIEKTQYSKISKYIYWASQPGVYSVKAFIMNEQGEKESILTETVQIDEKEDLDIINDPQLISKKESSITLIVSELWNNRKRIFRLSKYDFISQNKDSYLGKLWIFFNPLIQIAVYWFVFGIGIRNGKPIDGVDFLPWMLSGLIPWFFISAGVSRGASSIFSKANTMITLNYPISTVPLGVVLVAFYEHIATIAILFITVIFYGYYPSLAWINLLYYFVCMIFFVYSLSLVLSVLTMIARDFQKLIPSVLRLWFYLTPVLWVITGLPVWIQRIMKANPAYYIVTGYRDSLLYNKMFYEKLSHMIIFWIISFTLFTIGCKMQVKFRNKFIDML